MLRMVPMVNKFATLACVCLGLAGAGCSSSSDASSTGGKPGTVGSDAGGSLAPTGASGASGASASVDARPCGASTLTNGTFDFVFEGVTYKYLVHIPPSYDGTKRTPLVLNWHGLTSNAAQQEFFSNMDPVADQDGFLLAYPESPDASWTAGKCCPKVPTRNDAGFARALVEKISTDACVDAKRIYSTGMSNGGFMSHRLGCEQADLFAAIAPVAGKVGIPDCNPSRPMPVLEFHGSADAIVAYDTGVLSGENPPATVPETAANWAKRDGCKTGPEQTAHNGTVTCQTWSGCDAGVTVTLCTAEGEGHCWPGQSVCPYGAATTDMDATAEIAKFFKKFALP